MKAVARFLVRGEDGENVASLFCPVGDGMPAGVYEIREVLGEYAVVRVGDTALSIGGANALTANDLHDRVYHALMTKKEVDDMDPDVAEGIFKATQRR